MSTHLEVRPDEARPSIATVVEVDEEGEIVNTTEQMTAKEAGAVAKELAKDPAVEAEKIK